MDAKHILKRPYARRLTPQEDGGFLATIQEFPGCIADGKTADEALKRLESVAESWITAWQETGRDVPEPVDFHGFSGKIALRIPRGLHKQAAELASSEGTSINQLLTAAIAQYIGAKQALRQFVTHYAQNTRTLYLNLPLQDRATAGRLPDRTVFSLMRPQPSENRPHG